MTHRLIFLGSDPIALPALEAIVSGRCGPIELVSVYTQPDRPHGRGKKITPNEIKTWALERDVPVYQPERMRKVERLEIEYQEPDALLVMAFGHLLSTRLINAPRLGIWNLHTSLLPRYRGASPIQCAIANGDSETGVSLMRMVREMDAGPVLDVEKSSIEETDTGVKLERRLAEACVLLLERNLPRIFAGQAKPQEQDHTAATYVRKLTQEDRALDFHAPAAVLARRINGLYSWPGARFWHGDTPIKLGLAVADTEASVGQPGEVLGLTAAGLRVACGEGTLLLKRLQRPGGKMLDADEFMRGYELPKGTILPSSPMTELVTDAEAPAGGQDAASG